MAILEAREDLIVFADENLIAQVVTNLLKNAIQAISITSTNLGWEMPGTYDAILEIKNLSLTAILK